jgi:PPOX class probable F420-dependent enzyme
MMPKTYGLAGRRRARLPWAWARRRLVRAHNYWLSTTRPDGRPHAMPIWGLWLDETFLFSTARRSRKGRNLSRRPQAVVHLESGDQTVILEGRVREVRDPALLARYARAYHAKYRFRPDPADRAGVTYALRARIGFAWRERDFPKSATRWTL